MSRSAFERARRGTNPRPVTVRQRRYLRWLADQAGIELPLVRWSREADDAIKRLKARMRQPTLEGL